jgi:hypothetical protein
MLSRPSTWFMRIKTAALWTLGMAAVLGLSIGVAYGARSPGSGHSLQPSGDVSCSCCTCVAGP